MKVGDLVKDNHPSRSGAERVGVLIARMELGKSRLNKCFKVLWQSGTIGENVWDYDLKIVKIVDSEINSCYDDVSDSLRRE